MRLVSWCPVVLFCLSVRWLHLQCEQEKKVCLGLLCANKVNDKIIYWMTHQRERRLKAVEAFTFYRAVEPNVSATALGFRFALRVSENNSERAVCGKHLYAKGIWNWFGHHVFRERAGGVCASFFSTYILAAVPVPQVSWANIKGEPGRGDDKLRRHWGLLSSNSKAFSSHLWRLTDSFLFQPRLSRLLSPLFLTGSVCLWLSGH